MAREQWNLPQILANGGGKIVDRARWTTVVGWGEMKSFPETQISLVHISVPFAHQVMFLSSMQGRNAQP